MTYRVSKLTQGKIRKKRRKKVRGPEKANRGKKEKRPKRELERARERARNEGAFSFPTTHFHPPPIAIPGADGGRSVILREKNTT